MKVPEIYLELSEFAEVRMISSSEASLFFLKASEEYNPAIWSKFIRAGGLSRILSEELEWGWKKIGDAVFHIEVRSELYHFE